MVDSWNPAVLNDKVKNMQSGEGGGSSVPDYSNTEIELSEKYFDKTLYRKSYEVAITTSPETLEASFTGKTIIKAEGYIQGPSFGISIGGAVGNDSLDSCVHNVSGALNFYAASGLVGCTARITVYYTKDE